MSAARHRRHRDHRGTRAAGFTLIELLVTIAVIGVLAAIAIPVYLGQRAKAVDASMRADLRAAALAIEESMVDDPLLDSNVLPSGVKASPGNSIQMAFYHGSATNLYCIRVVNPRSSKGALPMLWGSSLGGLLPFGTYINDSRTCADTYWGGVGTTAGDWSVDPVTG